MAEGTAGKAKTVANDVKHERVNLPIIRRGKITYEKLAKPNADEIRAGNKFSELGYDVTFRKESKQYKVRSADLWVDGIGKVDVYTPKIRGLTKIVRNIEKKYSNNSGTYSN